MFPTSYISWIGLGVVYGAVIMAFMVSLVGACMSYLNRPKPMFVEEDSEVRLSLCWWVCFVVVESCGW